MWHIWTEGTIIPAMSNRHHLRSSVTATVADGQPDVLPLWHFPLAMVRRGIVFSLLVLFVP